ncbi:MULTISPECIES: hypothetical protein [unclassified Cryobacterium]|nr:MULTISPECIES: hypothetical protein [unclassified Cryobacterium]
MPREYRHRHRRADTDEGNLGFWPAQIGARDDEAGQEHAEEKQE